MKKTTVLILVLLTALAAGVAGFFGSRLIPHTTRAAGEAGDTAHEHSAAQGPGYFRCPMHPWITSKGPSACPICGMDLTPVEESAAQSEGVRIDPATVQTIGVTFEPVQRRTLTREIRLAAAVQADERRIYTVSTKVMGFIEKLRANATGIRVNPGDTLYELYSPDLVNAQEEFLQACRGTDSSAIASARARMLNWDISPGFIQSIRQSGSAMRTVPFISAVAGVISTKNVTQGQNVMPGMNLFTITDLSSVWIAGQAYQSDLAFIKKGQRASVTIDFMAGKTFNATVSFISPQIDPQDRTAQIRLELPNTADLSIRPGMIATISITATAATLVTAVPEQAVIHTGERDVVVISTGNGFFQPREVRLGISAGGYVQILDGLQEQEQVVTSSQFLIDSESNLREAVKKLAASPDSTTDTSALQLHTHSEKPAAADMKSATAATPPGPQKTCPVMGGAINKKLFVDYNGQRIYMCCPGCTEAITNEPQKHIDILAKRGERVEKIKK